MVSKKLGPKDWTPLDGRRILIDNLGDVHPLDHGGTLVFEIWDRDGRRFESVRIDPRIDRSYEVRRWPIEKDVLRDASWVDGDHLQDLASYIGVDERYLKRASAHSDARVRARLYEDIGAYFGFDNLDAYPTRVTHDKILDWFPELA